MSNKREAIAVLGAGSYGTALALCLSRNQVPTFIWGRSQSHVQQLIQDRENKRYLPNFEFPDLLCPVVELPEAIKQANDLLLVVPSHGFKELLLQIKPLLTDKHTVTWATKGLEPGTGRLLHEVANEVLGDQVPLAVLSGPTFANEMAAALPTAISLSSDKQALIDSIASKLHCKQSFRVYKNADIKGVQLGGAVKNVIAIGAGLADGLGFGANARTALITRGLAEMARLGSALGASSETFMGMAGLGDLVLTCTDNQSRNRRFGLALGQGKEVDEAMKAIGQVVEGYRNTQEVKLLSESYCVEMPICEQIYAVLYQGKSAKEAALTLLSRDMREE